MTEKYSIERAQAEAEELQKRTESGHASSYSEAEKQVDSEPYQALIWRRPTDEEVAKLSKEIWVNASADIPIGNPGNLLNYRDLIARSGVARLIDLGSATTIFMRTDIQMKVEAAGIKEYVCVDAGLKDTEFRTRESGGNWADYFIKHNPSYSEPPPDEQLKIRTLGKEILAALHSMPDNYANSMMTGIEGGNVLEHYFEWGFAVLAELKRVVPKDGFIFTDSGFANEMLEKCSPEFTELRRILHRLNYLEKNKYLLISPHTAGEKGLTESEIEQEIEKLKEEARKYECQKDDTYNLKSRESYVIDAPQIGFRIYFSRTEDWADPIIIINTNKDRPMAAHFAEAENN